MNPEIIFEKVRAHFGGDGSDPVYDDVLLLSYLNDWIRDTLSLHITLGTNTATKTFTVTTPTLIEDDYTANAGVGLDAIEEVIWTPGASGGTPLVLQRTTERTLRALGKYPNRDLGVPSSYWMDFGVTTAITTPSFKLHLYPIPNATGRSSILSRTGPAACVAATAITFPEMFADAAEWFLVYRWRANDEDYQDNDRMVAMQAHDAALKLGLRNYYNAIGPVTIRQRKRGVEA